jgi:hypothetical protein
MNICVDRYGYEGINLVIIETVLRYGLPKLKL